ncbi:MAG TPA: RNA polymerase sigma factor [Gemmatimonadales bacterium]|jgi:RNA polymerase sigma-70 factor (ECF subfamily)|nr:RNA polymerase sigma factor [Gemmatimonadales bacterium]
MRRDELEAHLEREHAGAFAWALRCAGGGREEAEDALHAAYERILDGRAEFEGRSSFRTWLFGVIRLTARAERRRGWLRVERLRRWFSRGSAAGSGPGTGFDAGADLERRETARRLGDALDRLSERQRRMLHLVFYQDLSVQEAADVLGMPVGTARTHYQRGKARLRALLQGEDLG